MVTVLINFLSSSATRPRKNGPPSGSDENSWGDHWSVSGVTNVSVVTWNNYPPRPVRSCFARWVSKGTKSNCEAPAKTSVAIVLPSRCWAATEQLRSQRSEAWKECNRRLCHYYRTLAPQLPDSFREMEPLFSAVICGCNAGLFREALHEVYIPRIQRGDSSFAANVLGARGPLISVLVHFFEHGHWGSFVKTDVVEQGL